MIEPLPIAFKAKERIYRQLARKGIVALYEVRNFRHILIGFELIIIRYQKAKLRNFKTRPPVHFPERERYPYDEEFGRYGWSFPLTRELAELAFDHLTSTMPFGRSIPFSDESNYIGWGRNTRKLVFTKWLRTLSTGQRPAPNRTISNATPDPTERMQPKASHNEDSP